MSIRDFTTLGSNLASVADFKRIQTPLSLCCGFGGDKTLQLVGQAAEFDFESKFEPLQPRRMPLIWQSPRRLFQKVIEDLDHGQALGAALRIGLGGLDGRAQRLGVSESAAVAAAACGPRPARLTKTCYHCCDTDSVQELKRF